MPCRSGLHMDRLALSHPSVSIGIPSAGSRRYRKQGPSGHCQGVPCEVGGSHWSLRHCLGPREKATGPETVVAGRHLTSHLHALQWSGGKIAFLVISANVGRGGGQEAPRVLYGGGDEGERCPGEQQRLPLVRCGQTSGQTILVYEETILFFDPGLRGALPLSQARGHILWAPPLMLNTKVCLVLVSTCDAFINEPRGKQYISITGWLGVGKMDTC